MEKRDKPHRKPSLSLNGNHLEWGLAALSTIIVIAMIAFLGHQAMTQDKAHSDPVAVVTGIFATAQGYRVEFDARNAGKTTAAAVTFRANLLRDGHVIETADITFDYLPGHSHRAGTVIFRAKPRESTLVIRAVSYRLP